MLLKTFEVSISMNALNLFPEPILEYNKESLRRFSDIFFPFKKESSVLSISFATFVNSLLKVSKI